MLAVHCPDVLTPTGLVLLPLDRIVSMTSDAGRLTVDVAETLPFTDLASLHHRSEAGELHGKVVLTPPTAQPRV